MNIFYHSLGSMLVGVVLTIIGIILMYVLIRLWRRNSTFSIASIVVGIILFFFLFNQFCFVVPSRSNHIVMMLNFM